MNQDETTISGERAEREAVQAERELQERAAQAQREIDEGYKAPVQWEYQTFFVPPQDPVSAMNTLGEKGWEFIAMVGNNPQKGLLWLAKRTRRLVQLVSPGDVRTSLRRR